MPNNFLTFKKFNDAELAAEIGEQLKAKGIEYLIENNKQFFDASFANNSFDADISLKINATDFINAQNILNDYYKQQISKIGKDYYLYEFTDQELTEIISKPDEWGEFDYQLAQVILAERGKSIKPETVELLSQQRMKQLSKEETTSKYLIYRGYFSAFLGGLPAIFFGYDLAHSKKTMRDGTQVYSYPEQERKHGRRIIIIGIACFIISFFVYLYLRKDW